MILALHHKCASGWAVRVFSDITMELGIRRYTVNRAKVFSFSKSGHLIIIANCNYYELLENSKGVHIYRDPRDLIVSAYFSHRNSHPLEGWSDLENHRNFLVEVNQEIGLESELEFSHIFLGDMRSWNLEDEGFLHYGIEEIFGSEDHGYVFVTTVVKYLITICMGNTSVVSFNSMRLREIINKYTFEKLSGGRKRGIEDNNSNYRSGKMGDWKHLFNDRMKGLFKEQYGDILIQYGYEKNNDW